VDCHDGFTLNDLVSYDQKHNEANGEGNRDGNDDNMSWNCGVEGETDDPAINALRERQIKNFATIMLVSSGVPMFVAGDEVRRTQLGNNNAYCQDSPISWFDWNLVEKHGGLLRFWQILITHRRMHEDMTRRRFFTGEVNERNLPDLAWHGTKLFAPDWNDGNARALAFTLGGFAGDTDFHVMMNMYWEPLEFEIPPIPDRQWYRLLDTSLPSPQDIVAPGDKMLQVSDATYRVHDRSIAIVASQ
jgi:glycogen operon protein